MLPDLTVSVLIPTRNRPLATCRAVMSALQQTHPPSEVIVVDDGSDDPSALITALDSITDSRLRIHMLGRNFGGSYARNRAVELASGTVVAFLDSDDEWLPEKLAQQLATLSSGDDYTVVYCRYEASAFDGSQTYRVRRPDRAKRITESIGDYMFCNRGSIVTPSLLMSAALAKRVRFDETLIRHQEFGLLLKLESAGCSFLMCDRVLVRVNWEDLGTTRRHVNPIASHHFVERYRLHLSAPARGGFWLLLVVYPQFFELGYAAAMRTLLRRWEIVPFLALHPRELLKTTLFALGLSPVGIMRAARTLRAMLTRADGN